MTDAELADYAAAVDAESKRPPDPEPVSPLAELAAAVDALAGLDPSKPATIGDVVAVLRAIAAPPSPAGTATVAGGG